MKKRRQHHVWKSYLRAWAKDEIIFCLQDGRIFKSNISGVAVERDFYKLHTLSKNDIEYINFIIGKAHVSTTKVHDNFITMFSIYGRLKENMPAHLEGNVEFMQLLDQQIINAEEDFHSSIESGITPILDAIKRLDIRFYADDKLCGQFLHFLSLQLFRTKGVRERVIERVTDPPGFNIARCWNVLRHIFAVNVGGGLFLERKKRPFMLLENNTGMPFVTGDQPVTNLFRSPQRTEAPTLVALYYPITPWLAVILDETEERCGYGTSALSIDQVEELNREMHAASFSQVFGNSREVLASLSERREVG